MRSGGMAPLVPIAALLLPKLLFMVAYCLLMRWNVEAGTVRLGGRTTSIVLLVLAVAGDEEVGGNVMVMVFFPPPGEMVWAEVRAAMMLVVMESMIWIAESLVMGFL